MPEVVVDGVRLHYVAFGAGEPPIVFVHGWSCDHTHFAPQLAHFSPGHRVLSFDLRGHGSSEAPEGGYTIAGFADDIAAACRKLELSRPVVVGHSMGGMVAMELAARHPDLPRALVLIDSGVFVPEETSAPFRPLIEALSTPAYREVHAAIFDRLFSPHDDPVLRGELQSRAVDGCAQHVLASSLEQVASWDSASAARQVKVPLLYILGELGHGSPIDLGRFREACPQLMLGQTVGSGHFPQLFVPDQVNAMIDRFLAMLADG